MGRRGRRTQRIRKEEEDGFVAEPTVSPFNNVDDGGMGQRRRALRSVARRTPGHGEGMSEYVPTDDASRDPVAVRATRAVRGFQGTAWTP